MDHTVAVAHERRERDRFGLPKDEYISALVERMVVTGTTRIRTHTDVDPGVGLRGVTAVNEVARRYADAVTIEQVAFPQGGLISNPGTLELLEEAIAGGVAAIGGLDPAGFDNAPNNPIFIGNLMLTTLDNASTSATRTATVTGSPGRVSWREMVGN